MATSATSVDVPRRLRRHARVPFEKDWLSRFGLISLGLFVLIAVAGPELPIGSPNKILAGPRLSSPSWDQPLGTDSLGRAMLPRVVDGVRNSFLIAAVAVAITTVLAVMLGTLAGYRRGLGDAAISRMSDILFAFPTILLALLIAAITGPGEKGVVIAIVLVTLPLMVRVVRSSTLAIARREFVIAAEVSGASLARIIAVHLLPNIAGAVALQMTYAMSISMLVESGLSFLGVGIQPPAASLGSLVHDGIDYMTLAPWLIFVPGAVLALAILSVTLVGDGLRDRFDPQKPRPLE
jgi:peptide/nickel transport system permease protein